MKNMSWINDPRLVDLHPTKKEIIVDLATEVEGKSLQQSLPIFMNANKRLGEKNMSFSKEESSLVMEILMKDMSPSEKSKVQTMLQMVTKMQSNR